MQILFVSKKRVAQEELVVLPGVDRYIANYSTNTRTRTRTRIHTQIYMRIHMHDLYAEAYVLFLNTFHRIFAKFSEYARNRSVTFDRYIASYSTNQTQSLTYSRMMKEMIESSE